MASPAALERSALCDLFVDLGPDAPTLAGSWTTRDLAAHLVVRERRPDAAAGIVAPPLAAYTERVRIEEAARPWSELVARVRRGPPLWSPMRVAAVDGKVNTIEFFVHHEDVRRAQQPWSPRQLSAQLEDALAGLIGLAGRLLARGAPAGIALDVPGRRAIRIHRGASTVTIHGPIGECLLFLYGRGAVAAVELEGPPAAVDAVRAHSFGF